MLPYHWPHPTWNLQDSRGQPPHYSGAHHSQDPRWNLKPCCAAHTESISQLQRQVIHLEGQVKAVLNHLADQSLCYPRLSPAIVTPPLLATTSNSERKKRVNTSRMDSEVGESKTSTSMKRRKLIQDLEQQVAEERVDNQRMEKRIVEMRQHLAELRSRRHALTQERLNREIENGSQQGETDQDRADSDVSEQEEENALSDRDEEDD